MYSMVYRFNDLTFNDSYRELLTILLGHINQINGIIPTVSKIFGIQNDV